MEKPFEFEVYSSIKKAFRRDNKIIVKMPDLPAIGSALNSRCNLTDVETEFLINTSIGVKTFEDPSNICRLCGEPYDPKRKIPHALTCKKNNGHWISRHNRIV